MREKVARASRPLFDRRSRHQIFGPRDQRRRYARSATNTLSPATPGPKSPPKLTPADDQFMRAQTADNPGITALQLQPMLIRHVAECSNYFNSCGYGDCL